MGKVFRHIILSRTDSIGDVVLTLPMAGLLKKYFPDVKISFLAKEYTRPVIEACKHVDAFIDLHDFLKSNKAGKTANANVIIHVFPVLAIAKKARHLQLPLRIGTSHRWYHWFTCNKLVHFSRRNASLHEAQLNLKLLEPLGIESNLSTEEISLLYGLENIQPLQPEFQKLIEPGKYHLILHPKSQGSSREWALENYITLIHLLDKKYFKIFVSGTEKEKPALQPLFEAVKEMVTDVTGKMHLEQFISFIRHSHGMVACSTGPLHMAAAMGKDAFGIYPPRKPIHPGRWGPVGKNAQVFALDHDCLDCKKNSDCTCINAIRPEEIKMELEKRATALFSS
jgi:heptosyltransferase-3